MPSSSRRSRLVPLAALAAAAVGLGSATPVTADPDEPMTFVPIGGGYETLSLEGFARQAAEQADGATVDLLVVPSAYGDAIEDRPSNIAQAQARTDQLDAACDTVVAAEFPAFTGCTATLVMLFDRSEAMDPANSVAFTDPENDGAYVLGGDQVLAMQIIANSPAETAMTQAADRGMVYGGTSAGNAVESRTMLAGYAGPGYPWNAMERGMALVFWGDDLASDERGLAFASDPIIFDQHFYQRGRFGRLLSITGESVERYGDQYGAPGKLGVGVDWATGVVDEDDETLGEVFGYSSVTLMDYTTASTPQWVGERQTLSVRDVTTHLMPQGAMSYDVATRTPVLDSQPVADAQPADLPALRTRGNGSLLLGGGQNDDADSPVLARLVAQAGKGPIVVVAAGYDDEADARDEAASYAEALAGAGWRGQVSVLVQGADRIGPAQLNKAAAVVLIGGDQALLGDAARDKGFAQAMHAAIARGPVLTDGAATALMGDYYVTDADPGSDYENDAIAEFQVGKVHLARGLGEVPGFTVQPTLTYDYHWGRLYNAAMQHPGMVSLGLSELTALELRHGAGTVVGERSVIAVDGRESTFFTGDNGAIGAVNVLLDAYAPGDRVE